MALHGHSISIKSILHYYLERFGSSDNIYQGCNIELIVVYVNHHRFKKNILYNFNVGDFIVFDGMIKILYLSHNLNFIAQCRLLLSFYKSPIMTEYEGH